MKKSTILAKFTLQKSGFEQTSLIIIIIITIIMFNPAIDIAK